MIVLKFGGSALCDASAILLCAKQIAATEAPCAIVVSALRGVTRQLLELCQQGPEGSSEVFVDHHQRIVRYLCEDHPPLTPAVNSLNDSIAESGALINHYLKSCLTTPEHQAEILSQGEWVSAQIMQQLLLSFGMSLSLLDPRQFIRTQGSFLHADVVLPDTLNRLMELREGSQGHYLMPGFFGGNHSSSQTSLLGPNSSDYSGALLAAGLGAFGYEIWKDIDGIFEADPKLSPRSHLKKHLSYRDVIDQAPQFAQVIHPAVAPLLQPLGTPIFVRNIFRPELKGSMIADQEFFAHKDR